MFGSMMLHCLEYVSQTGMSNSNIYVDGSNVLVHTKLNMIWSINRALWVCPTLADRGKRLFPDVLRVNLKLLETTPFPSGVVLMRYQPSRAEATQ